MMKEENNHSELTSLIIECALAVHKLLGNGFQEGLYQRALEIEMHLRGIKFKTEIEMPIFYKCQLIGTRGVGFLVEGLVTVELKAVKMLEDADLVQSVNHLEAHSLESWLVNKLWNYKP